MSHYSNRSSITASICDSDDIHKLFVNKTFAGTRAFVDVYLTAGPAAAIDYNIPLSARSVM